MNLRSRIAYTLRNPSAATVAVRRRFSEPLIRLAEVSLAWIIRRRSVRGAVWRALRTESGWTPQPNLTIGAEILRRVRLIPDPQGANRNLPHRWRIIFNEIRARTGNDVDWSAGPVFLSFGAGDRHPMGLPLLAGLAGASKAIALEPGPVRGEFATATLQETLWDVVRDPAAYGLMAADLGRLRSIVDADALWCGDPLSAVLSKGSLELLRAAGERAAFAPESIDIVYSRSVLEHVIEIEAAMTVLVRALRPRGIMFHDIGLDAHDERDRVGFYYAERGHAVDAYSGLNFWRLSDFVALFERLGCTVEVADIETVSISQIDRSRIVSRFAGYSDDDLRTVGAKLLVRKSTR